LADGNLISHHSQTHLNGISEFFFTNFHSEVKIGDNYGTVGRIVAPASEKLKKKVFVRDRNRAMQTKWHPQ